MNDAKQIERDLLRELKARGVTMTDLKRRQVREVAGDMALVERLRDQINNGAALDLDSFMKLKASATASRAELFDGLLPIDRVDRIEVVLIDPDGNEVPWRRPKTATTVSEQTVTSASPSTPQSAEPSQTLQATPPPAAPAPSNVVPISETVQQRKARLEAAFRCQPATVFGQLSD